MGQLKFTNSPPKSICQFNPNPVKTPADHRGNSQKCALKNNGP